MAAGHQLRGTKGRSRRGNPSGQRKTRLIDSCCRSYELGDEIQGTRGAVWKGETPPVREALGY